jgi:hypothetical protein
MRDEICNDRGLRSRKTIERDIARHDGNIEKSADTYGRKVCADPLDLCILHSGALNHVRIEVDSRCSVTAPNGFDGEPASSTTGVENVQATIRQKSLDEIDFSVYRFSLGCHRLPSSVVLVEIH